MKRSYPYLLVKNKILILFLLLTVSIFANEKSNILSKDAMTLEHAQSDEFSKLLVYYHGRVCPLQTLAIDFTTKLTGKSDYKYANAEQVLLGWIFFPEKWQHVPFFKIKHPELKRLLNCSEEACFADFFNADKSYKLSPYMKNMYSSEKMGSFAKEAVKLDEKIQLIVMLQNGSLLQLFPHIMTDGSMKWLTPTDNFPEEMDKMEAMFAHNFFPMYYKCIQENKSEEALVLLHKLSNLQRKKAILGIPSEAHCKVEMFYNKLNIFSWLFKINLFLGSLGILFFMINTIRNTSWKKTQQLFYALLIIVFIFQTFGIFLRGYIGGRLPVSNGYETMLFIAWCALLIGLITKRYSFLFTLFSFLLSGFTLLVAHIGSMNPQITPLVPVLQSPLLNIHVFLIMVSYGLCGFMAFNSITSFILIAFAKNNPKTSQQVLRMKEMSELFMFPATFFIGAGIFVGAIWANVSWGRYWGWDPKEVWALITFLLMGFTFHGKTIKWFRSPVFYHLFVIIIFASVLMTYFGVNYILGGKHSYGG